MAIPANYLFGDVNISRGRFVNPVPLNIVSVADLPAPSQHRGAILIVGNGAGGDPVLVQSDGSNWRRVDTGGSVNSGPQGVQLGESTGLGIDISGITGVEISLNGIRQVRHTRMFLNSFVVNVTAANDFGSAALFNFPDRNIVILGIELALTFEKGAATGGIVATTDLNVSLGTAAATGNPPSGAAADIVPVQSITTDALAPALEFHTNELTTPALSFIDDAPNSQAFLNIGVSPGITADDTVNALGALDIFFIDTGNIGS
jgi:hypothetical protein